MQTMADKRNPAEPDAGSWEAGRKMTDKGLMQDRTSLMEIDRAKGILFGLAIGDALGFPTEFMTLSSIKKKYGQSGITDLPGNPALYTDDTQMSISVAEALAKAGERDLESIMEAVREEFTTWRHSPENNRAPGNTCLQGGFEHGARGPLVRKRHSRLQGMRGRHAGGAHRLFLPGRSCPPERNRAGDSHLHPRTPHLDRRQCRSRFSGEAGIGRNSAGKHDS